jgi:hypothetical protein
MRNYFKKEKDIKEKITKDDVKNFLGWLVRMLVVLGIIFLIGIAINALFPSLSLLTSILLAFPTFFILVLLFFIVASIVNPHV